MPASIGKILQNHPKVHRRNVLSNTEVNVWLFLCVQNFLQSLEWSSEFSISKLTCVDLSEPVWAHPEVVQLQTKSNICLPVAFAFFFARPQNVY